MGWTSKPGKLINNLLDQWGLFYFIFLQTLPLAVAISPIGCAMFCEDTGAIQIGMLIFSPRIVVDMLTSEIPHKIFGRILSLLRQIWGIELTKHFLMARAGEGDCIFFY